MVSELSTSAMEKSQQTLASSSSSHFVPISFNHSTSVKLENHNFLIWRKQIFSAIRGHNLQHFVIGVHDPSLKFRSSEDRSQGIVNQDFLDWEQQDQLLVSWLLSSMFEGVLSRCINCESAFQIWKTLEVYFASQTRIKISQYKTLLQNTKKESLSMNEYLLKIRGFVDLLALVGVNLSVKDHIDAITDGLLSEYDTFFLTINSRTEDYSIEEIESLLLAQEARIEKHNKRLLKLLLVILHKIQVTLEEAIFLKVEVSLVTISFTLILAEVIFLLEEGMVFKVEVVLTMVVGDPGTLGIIMLLLMLKNQYAKCA